MKSIYQWILVVRVTSFGKIGEKWCQIISHLEILFREFSTLIAWKIKIVIQIIRMGYSKFMHFCKWNHNISQWFWPLMAFFDFIGLCCFQHSDVKNNFRTRSSILNHCVCIKDGFRQDNFWLGRYTFLLSFMSKTQKVFDFIF